LPITLSMAARPVIFPGAGEGAFWAKPGSDAEDERADREE